MQTDASRAVDVDEYDLDLDLSDDDEESEEDEVQDEHRTASRSNAAALFRATRNGWVRDGTLLRSDSGSGNGALDSKASSLTPSVEGGYNVFKPPYTAGRFAVEEVRSDPVVYDHVDMDLAHSHDAAALRKAHKADQTTFAGGPAATASAVGDVSLAGSDDRFADAEEEDRTDYVRQQKIAVDMHRGHSYAGSSELSEGVSPGVMEDEELGGVSFSAGRRNGR